MQRNPITISTINFKDTFIKLKAAVDKLRIIEPPKEEGGRPKVKELIKGNVYSTAKEIYRLLISQNKKKSHSKVFALETKNPSLAKQCHNSARTIQRHIEKLIEHGILHAKNRLGHGLQLLLNPELIAWEPKKPKDHPVIKLPSARKPEKAPEPNPGMTASVDELLRRLDGKFSINRALRTP